MPHQFMGINCKKCDEFYCPVCLELCPKCNEPDLADENTMITRALMRAHGNKKQFQSKIDINSAG